MFFPAFTAGSIKQFHLLTGQLCWGGTNLCVSRLDLKGLPLERFDSVVKHFYRSPIENREISQNVRVAPSPVSTFSEKKTLENKRAAIETKNPGKEQLQFPGFIGSAQASESGWSKHIDQHLIDNCKDSRKEKYTLEDLDAAKFLRSEGLDNGNECVQAVYDQFFPKFPQ